MTSTETTSEHSTESVPLPSQEHGSTRPLLRAVNLEKHFPVTRGVMQRVVGLVRAVDGVSFDIQPGETLGLVGESGCGKTTVGRLLLQLLRPTGGKLEILGRDVTTLNRAELKQLRRDVQIIFQDPYSSLNPRMRVFDIVGEALRVHGIVRGDDLKRRVESILSKVGISPAWVNRFPHEFSGGQRQRIGVARAIAMRPKLVVCDEAVSALDVSIQAQVLNLLMDLREELGLAYLFISHDLSVVRHISHRVAVMYLGQIVELAPVAELFNNPRHPYTRALLSAVPRPDPKKKRRRLVLAGDVPTPLNPPNACRFHTRCPLVFDRCRQEEPEAFVVSDGHVAKCFLATDLKALGAMDTATPADSERGKGTQTARALEHERIAAEEHSTHVAGASSLKGEAVEATEPSSTDGIPTLSPEVSSFEGEPTPEVEEAPNVAESSVGRSLDLQPQGDITDALSTTWLGVALLALATVLVLGDWWLLGMWVGIVGYVLVPRGRWTTRRIQYHTPSGRPYHVERRSFIAFWVALGLAIALSLPITRVRTRWQAENEIESLRIQLSQWKQVAGNYPTSMKDLGWRLFDAFPSGEAIDPWGSPYRYRRVDADGSSDAVPYQLGSWGPDKKYGEDDIGNPPPPAAGQAPNPR